MNEDFGIENSILFPLVPGVGAPGIFFVPAVTSLLKIIRFLFSFSLATPEEM